MRLAQARNGLAVLLAVGPLAACGGGGNEASPGSSATTTHHDMTQSTTANMQRLAETYRDEEIAVNANRADFNASVHSWTKETTAVEAEQDAAGLEDAYQQEDYDLPQIKVPPPVALDVKALVRAQDAVIQDFGGLDGLGSLPAGTWQRQFFQDEKRVSAAGKTLRADLGLPPGKQ